MDRKIVFIPSGSLVIKPIVMGGGNESYFFLGAKMLVFVLHRSDMDEIVSSIIPLFVREAGPLGYSFLCQYPFPEFSFGIEAFV
jgi:hypothetical protein